MAVHEQPAIREPADTENQTKQTLPIPGRHTVHIVVERDIGIGEGGCFPVHDELLTHRSPVLARAVHDIFCVKAEAVMAKRYLMELGAPENLKLHWKGKGYPKHTTYRKCTPTDSRDCMVVSNTIYGEL